MVNFDINRIKKEAESGFTPAWLSTAKLLPRNTKISLEREGKSLPLRNLIQKSREVLLKLGFDEVENLTILPDSDVLKQYGPEARVILDRAFYLAELPRPEIGLNNKKIAQIHKISEKIDIDELRRVLRSYKLGEIEADDLVEQLAVQLAISDSQAIDLLDKVFPEMKKIQPIPTNNTLRSHMTGTWFHTLRSLQNKRQPPIALFSVGLRYRNEQREDAHHLRVHHSASVAVMDPEMSLEAGKEITNEIFKELGFREVRFDTKKATSKYYAPEQEQEVFASFRGEWVEVADIGMYSPVALANFDIRWPVFNAGFGIERLGMLFYDSDDMRKFVFPQFASTDFSDEDIVKNITYIQEPETARGKRIAKAIENTARQHRDELGPCSFVAWEDNSVRVTIEEKEEGKRLIGPAGFNEICVKNGEIVSSLTPVDKYTGINYMHAIATGAAAAIENSQNDQKIQVKVVKHLSDINLQIPLAIREYIEGKQRKIKVGGPVFVEITAQHLV
jgi:O-phosphoseryl-tRNA synthetase